MNFGRSNADDIVRGATTLIFIADGDAAVSSAERHGIDAHILADKIVAFRVALTEATWILLLKARLDEYFRVTEVFGASSDDAVRLLEQTVPSSCAQRSPGTWPCR